MPSPTELAAYKEIDTELPNRILSLFERTQEAKMELQLTPVRSDAWGFKFATFGAIAFPFALLGVSVLMVLNGHDVAAVIAGTASALISAPHIIKATRRS